MTAPHVLLVDDDGDLRDALATALDLAGLTPVAVADGKAALEMIDRHAVDVVVSDIRMPGIDGRQLLQRLTARDPDLPVILMTGHGDIDEAVAALRQGAYDFLAKPFATERLIETVRRAADKRKLVMENRRLRIAAAARDDQQPLPLIGNSPAVQRLAHVVTQLAGTQVDVVIEGEWGVGKEVLAHAIAQREGDRHDTVHVFDCEALPEHLIETVLFGNALSGGARRITVPGGARGGAARGGALAAAQGRTLLLSGVDALPLAIQSRLLHSLAHRDLAYRDPGSGDPAAMPPMRVVSTTTANLPDRVAAGRFRADLYFRIAPVRLTVPPLRERAGDIPLLFLHLLETAARHYQRPVPDLSDAMLVRLASHDWPGNLRELQNYAEQTILNLDRAEQALPSGTKDPLPVRVARFEAEALRAALRSEAGRIPAACARLGLPRKTFYDKLARYGIKPDDYRG